MKNLESMKETLIGCIQGQLSHLDSVDAKELGEVVDMVKDLSEAIYYCTITDAMKEKDEHRYYAPERRDMDRDKGRMYYPGDMYYDPAKHDHREGRSPMMRKTYMEHKELHHGKEVQLQELDKYMQELSHDLTEMIEDSSIEEKQMLQRKLTALASKIV